MPNNPCSPNLAPTSPTRAGATTESVLAHRPPPYGGEHAAEPTSDHRTNTPNPAQKGEHKGEHNTTTGDRP